MNLFLRRFFLTLLTVVQLSCSQNVLSELGSKNSDEALLIDARTSVNVQDYSTAITIITTKMSASGQSQAAAKEVLASAYAGRCGLNFIDFVNALSTTSSGSAFIIVSTPFVGRVVDPPSCLSSLTTIESIGPTASRTTSQNAFAAIVGMSLMGSAVRLYTDALPTNGDAHQDSNNISCTLTNTQVDYIVLGFGFMSQNFSYVSAAQLGSSSSTTLTGVISTCQAVAGGASCTITDPANITQPIRDTIKDLMNSVEYGIGTFVAGSPPALLPAACP